MKSFFVSLVFVSGNFFSSTLSAQPSEKAIVADMSSQSSNHKHGMENLYIDIQHLGAGKVKYEDVVKAHTKDLAIEKKYGVNIISFWFDESKGDVYCLVSAADTQSIQKTHAEAHGLLFNEIFKVEEGPAVAANSEKKYFLDVHQFGPGKVTAKDVAAAHQKDLAVEKKHGVNIINYWFNEEDGVVMCLSQAKDSTSILETHKEAHGLLPAYIIPVKPGK